MPETRLDLAEKVLRAEAERDGLHAENAALREALQRLLTKFEAYTTPDIETTLKADCRALTEGGEEESDGSRLAALAKALEKGATGTLGVTVFPHLSDAEKRR